jgi:hypothetical protein
MWCDVAWRGCGVVWCGVVWCGVVWCGVVVACVQRADADVRVCVGGWVRGRAGAGAGAGAGFTHSPPSLLFRECVGAGVIRTVTFSSFSDVWQGSWLAGCCGSTFSSFSDVWQSSWVGAGAIRTVATFRLCYIIYDIKPNNKIGGRPRGMPLAARMFELRASRRLNTLSVSSVQSLCTAESRVESRTVSNHTRWG